MKNKIQKISISNPCLQKWNSMKDIGDAKFCSNCNKNVRNFERFGNKEILQILNKEEQKICGRFKLEQIEEINNQLNKSKSIKLNKKLISVAISGLLITTACRTHRNHYEIEYNYAKYEVKSNIENKDSIITSIISGKLIDENNEAVKYANIHVERKGTLKHPKGTISDEDGKFELEIPNNEEYEKMVKISFLGYQSSHINLDDIRNKQIEITMEDAGIILGAICIEKKK